MTRPTEQFTRELKPNGLHGRTIKKNSYVVTMCKIGGDEVLAARIEYYQNKEDVHKVIDKQYPGWKVKTISKLYEEDFEE